MRSCPAPKQCVAVLSRIAACGLFLLPLAARAEGLSETDIRTLYSQEADAVKNPQRNLALMKARLDDSFVMTAHGKDTTVTLTKPQLIARTMQGYQVMKIDSFEQDIKDVKFSDDKQWGYISLTTTIKGTMDVPPANGARGIKARVVDAESCTDTLANRDRMLKVVRSDCEVQTVVTPLP